MRTARIAGLLLALLAFVPFPVHAAAPTNEGLQISPIRRELKADPGASENGEIIVANLTKQTLAVTLYFQEFSVTNRDYDYSFQPSHYDWIKLAQNELSLTPGQSKTVPFVLAPGAGASPGGYYFTIFASSNVQSGGIDSTIRAASQLYVTVNGRLDRSTRLDNIDIPSVLFGSDITYGFDMTNTGNVYYGIYSIATLDGSFGSTRGETAAHIVLPDKPRHLTGSIPAPVLPGIYTATIGYRTDTGASETKSKTVLYLPPWGIVALIGLVIVAAKIVRIVRRRRT